MVYTPSPLVQATASNSTSDANLLKALMQQPLLKGALSQRNFDVRYANFAELKNCFGRVSLLLVQPTDVVHVAATRASPSSQVS